MHLLEWSFKAIWHIIWWWFDVLEEWEQLDEEVKTEHESFVLEIWGIDEPF